MCFMCILTPTEASPGQPRALDPLAWITGCWDLICKCWDDTQVREGAADALTCRAVFPAPEFTFVFLVQGIRQIYRVWVH